LSRVNVYRETSINQMERRARPTARRRVVGIGRPNVGTGDFKGVGGEVASELDLDTL
jgi:hypothetical protein